MEHNEISAHEVRVARAVRQAPGWLTNHDVAGIAGVAPRTARLHTKRLADIGLFDQVEVFPGHRYRWSDMAAKRDKGYLDRLNRAAEALGIDLDQ